MKKTVQLYIDIDNTIYNSARVVVEMLNERYGCDVNYEDIKGYDFKDKFPMLKENEVMNLFDDPTFYGRKNRDIFSAFSYMLYFFTYKNCRINFVTIGTPTNLINKLKWINEVFNKLGVDYNEFYGNYNDDNDKRFVDMSGGIFIDDNVECLRKSNASVKILLKNNSDNRWNKVEPNDELYIANDWDDVYEIIKFFCDNRGMIE